MGGLTANSIFVILCFALLFILPTNITNLHEALSMNLMATCSVARIFTNSNNFGYARHNSNKFGPALACAKIRVIRATVQVALKLKSLRFV